MIQSLIDALVAFQGGDIVKLSECQQEISQDIERLGEALNAINQLLSNMEVENERKTK